MEINLKKNYFRRLIRRDNAIFRDYIENTSANGVDKVFAERYSIIRRLFWLVLFLGSSAICLTTIVQSIEYLASDPTATSISVETIRPLSFPSVTVCNLNVFTASSLEDVGLLDVGIQALNANPFTGNPDDCDRALNNVSEANEVMLEELWNAPGSQSITRFIQHCTFLGKPCDYEHDFTFTTLGFGACYSFNGYSRTPPLETNGTGMNQGLTMILNISQSEYTSTPLLDAGARIFVHPSSQPAPIRDRGITLAPGRVAFIAVEELRIINDAKKGCSSSHDGQFQFIGNIYNYSFGACLVDCYLKRVADVCGCYYGRGTVSPNSASYSDIRNCTFRDVCCIQDVLAEAVDCNCPHVCRATTYNNFKSYSAMPADYTSEFFGYNKEEYETNFVGVFVYFETNVVTTETTSPAYGFVDLLSDMGGQLGLFIGVSVITGFELLVWILDEAYDRLCCFTIKWKFRKEKQEKKEEEGQQQNGDFEMGYSNGSTVNYE